MSVVIELVMLELKLVCLLGTLLIVVKAFVPPAGPYDIKIDRLENCEDEGTKQVHFGSKLSKSGAGKYVYSSPFTLGVPIDENAKIYVEVQQWGNGGYRPRTIEHTANNCKEIWKVLQNPIKDLMKSAGVNLENCPIPAGNYTASNWELDLKLNSVPTMAYNKYRCILTFYYKDVKVGCEVVYAETVPKGAMG